MAEPLENQPESAPAEKSGRKMIIRVVAATIVLVAAGFGIRHMLWSRTHESTENAQVAGDVVIVSPLVSGTVEQILVADNAQVQKGDVLVRLDESKLRAAVQQAEANLAAAVADAQAAGIAVTYAEAANRAEHVQAQGGVSEAEAGVGASKVAVASATANLTSAKAQAKAAAADLENAVLQREIAQENLSRAQAMAKSAAAMLESAKEQVKTAEARRQSAAASQKLTEQELDRTQRLFDQGATSRQELERKQAAAQSARAELTTAASQVSSARAAVEQRQSELVAAQSQVNGARAAIQQVDSRTDAARQNVKSAEAGVEVARLQISAAEQAARSSEARRTTSVGKQSATEAGEIQVQQLSAGQKQAQAKVEQAQAALVAARLDLAHATIVAPVDGRVSKRLAEIGGQAQVGGPLLYLVPDDGLYVVANFKETQIARIGPGDPVEVEVDGIPGVEIHGKVDSLSAATGAAFALLPPDNATGNFVKVVQRVPVKIRLDQRDLPKHLRVGLSATVTVTVK